MMKKIVGLMLMSLCLMSFGTYANTAVSTAIINTVAASSIIDDPETEHVDEPVVSVKIEAKEKSYNVEPAGSYMLTICSREQSQTALAWQTVCVADRNRSFVSTVCPIMSYLRYCQPATAQEVKGLKPLKANYNNVFLRE
jgi:hypothetical protein